MTICIGVAGNIINDYPGSNRRSGEEYFGNPKATFGGSFWAKAIARCVGDG
jgi:hypothetical protein